MSYLLLSDRLQPYNKKGPQARARSPFHRI